MASIAAICASLPQNKIQNEHFLKWHEQNEVDIAADLVGVQNRYWASKDVSSLDLNVKAAKSLLDTAPMDSSLAGELREHIDLLIFVTQTPDSMMPGMAYKAHEALKLPEKCRCISVNAGCSGYVENVSLAIDILHQHDGKYALVLVGDVLSHYIDPQDRSTALIFGDAGSATLIDNVSQEHRNSRSAFVGGSRGEGKDHIRLALASNAYENNTLHMNGLEVFNFTISQIPKFINKIKSKWTELYEEDPAVDLYLLHQANRMILSRVAKKIKIDPASMPINIDKYGNTSGATIPLLLVDLLNNDENIENARLLLCGFGVGLGWGAMIIEGAKIHNAGIVFCDQ